MRLSAEVGWLDTVRGENLQWLCAEVAQSVEQRTENPCVPSSILGLGTLAFILLDS